MGRPARAAPRPAALGSATPGASTLGTATFAPTAFETPAFGPPALGTGAPRAVLLGASAAGLAAGRRLLAGLTQASAAGAGLALGRSLRAGAARTLPETTAAAAGTGLALALRRRAGTWAAMLAALTRLRAAASPGAAPRPSLRLATLMLLLRLALLPLAAWALAARALAAVVMILRQGALRRAGEQQSRQPDKFRFHSPAPGNPRSRGNALVAKVVAERR